MLFTVNSRVFSDRIAFTCASAEQRLVAWEIFWGNCYLMFKPEGPWV